MDELAELGIDKKREVYAYYNARRGIDQNKVEDHLRTMKYYDSEGQIIEEPCVFKFPNMTIIGNF